MGQFFLGTKIHEGLLGLAQQGPGQRAESEYPSAQTGLNSMTCSQALGQSQ